ncbi:MAG: hypothetical protein RLZZ406_329 [Pseudomonadota bacterium]
MHKRPPTHPGAILREDVFPTLGISVTEFAKRLGISRQTLHSVLAEKSSITPELALRIGAFLGNGPWEGDGYRLINGLLMMLMATDLALRLLTGA